MVRALSLQNPVAPFTEVSVTPLGMFSVKSKLEKAVPPVLVSVIW